MDVSNPKPFKTVEEQVALLETRGVLFSDKPRAEAFLLKQNYYAVVNGYKDSFLNKQQTNLAGEDRYVEGTDFESFEMLFSFDKALRGITMDVLLEAEGAMKTATVYAFCEVHGEVDAYLDPANYCKKADYRPSDRYTKGLIQLLSTLQGVRDNRPHKQYIKHYEKEYHCLPLWVASKCLTFGNMSAFFDYQQQSVKTRTCVALSRSLGKDVIKQRQLAFAYHILPSFRNICAHGERLFCTKVGKQEDMGFDQLIRALETTVTTDELARYASGILSLLDGVRERNPELEGVILGGMNVQRSRLEELGGSSLVWASDHRI